MSFSISGTVTDASSGQPVSGASMQLVAAQNVLGAVTGATADGPGYTWSHVINGADLGSENFRDAAYMKYVNGDVPTDMLSRTDFYTAVEDWNPALISSGNLFQPGSVYFIATTAGGQEFALTTTTDGSGSFRFDGLQNPGVYGMVVTMAGYATSHSGWNIEAGMVASDGVTLTWPSLSLQPARAQSQPPQSPQPSQPSASSDPSFTMHTLEQNLTPAQRRFVECAINMVASNENDAYDFLGTLQLASGLNLQTMANGWNYRNQPNSVNFKDIDCADLLSICYAYTFGQAPQWQVSDPSGGGHTGHSSANFYCPANVIGGGNVEAISGQVATLSLDDDWQPGDAIIYWDAGSLVPDHINMYVGSFTGTDREGKTRNETGQRMVVNTSLDFGGTGDIWGPQDAIFPLNETVSGFSFATRQHIRLRDLFS